MSSFKQISYLKQQCVKYSNIQFNITKPDNIYSIV